MLIKDTRWVLYRFGLIVPSSNTTMETEFHKMLPESFTVHVARLRLEEVSLKGLAKMEEKIEEEAVKLSDADVNVIGYGCTIGSLLKGIGYDRVIEERIERVTKKPAVTTAGAVISALRELSIKKLAVATPYSDELNIVEEKFLKASGLSIIDMKSLGLSDNIKIGMIDEKTVIQLIMSLNYKEADGIFISCTNFPTIKVIQRLEDTLRKPIISSNTATLWAMLKKCAIKANIKGYGMLLEER